MRTIETTIFQFDELTDTAKERARSWYREASVGDEHFSEYIIEDAKQIGALMGITMGNVYYSGFWSQGDGACFTGAWFASAVKPGAVMDYASQDAELHRIAKAFEEAALAFPEASFCVSHRGHYSHEMSAAFEVDLAGSEELSEAREKDADSFEENLIESARDLMRWIYRALEKEHEYQNADEQVEDMIRANEYEFEEDGSRA